MIRKEKRGISPVIATILLILITVAAVSIIWAFVLPFMKEKVGEVDKNVDLSILTERGFTYFDYANNISSVQVKKGEENVNITQIIFIFEKQGETKEIRGLFSIPNGQTQTFYIPLTKSYDSVSLAAVVLNGKKEKETGVLQIANFIRGDVPVEDAGVLNGKVDEGVYVKNDTGQFEGITAQKNMIPITGNMVKDLPDFKIKTKYDSLLYDFDKECLIKTNNCVWSVHSVFDKQVLSDKWFERKDPKDLSRPMLPLGISFKQEGNLAHLYHAGGESQVIPSSRRDGKRGNRPIEFKIVMKLTLNNEEPKYFEYLVDLKN